MGGQGVLGAMGEAFLKFGREDVRVGSGTRELGPGQPGFWLHLTPGEVAALLQERAGGGLGFADRTDVETWVRGEFTEG